MGKVVSFLQDELVLTSHEVLLKVGVRASEVSLIMAGKGWNAKALLQGSNLIRFVGGCFASGYGLQDFAVETVASVQVEQERIRIIKEGTENDRGFIRLSPEEFLLIGTFITRRISYSVAHLELQGNHFHIEKQDHFFTVSLENALKQKEQAILPDEESILRFFTSLLASALGREKQAQRIETNSSPVKVKEKLEIKDDMQKPITVVLGNQQETKTLEEWIRFLNNTAQTADKIPTAIIKAWLKKNKIPYSSKVSISINKVEVRLPSHWALGIYKMFEKFF